MPTIVVIDGLRIELRYRDHNPPHIHALRGDGDALIAIADGAVLKNNRISNKDIKTAQTYLDINRAELLAFWNEINSNRQ